MTSQLAWAAGRLFRYTMLLGLLALPLTSGCTWLGYGAYALSGASNTAAAYPGLAGQNVAVMVWADQGLRIDYENLQSDTAMTIQTIFTGMSTGKDPSKDLTGTKFLDPRAVLRFQEDHPELEATPVVKVAPRLQGVTRLIYIEISQFETHSPMSIDLFHGLAKASIKVLEIKNGVAKVVYSENDISAVYPAKSKEGISSSDSMTAEKVYRGTITELAQRIAERFYAHPTDEDDDADF